LGQPEGIYKTTGLTRRNREDIKRIKKTKETAGRGKVKNWKKLNGKRVKVSSTEKGQNDSSWDTGGPYKTGAAKGGSISGKKHEPGNEDKRN